MEAMEDFPGGVGEMYETKSAPNNLFSLMKKALDRSSMLSCSIDVRTTPSATTSTTSITTSAPSLRQQTIVEYKRLEWK